MKRSRNTVIYLAALVLLGIAIYRSVWTPEEDTGHAEKAEAAKAAWSQSEALEQKPSIGYLAPNFSLKGLDGKEYGFEAGQPRSKLLLVNFWASWCPPCKEEAPDLTKLYRKYGKELDIYAINAASNDTVEKAKDFADSYRYRFPVLLDSRGEILQAYKVIFIPATYIIDKNGVIIDKFNFLETEELEKRIQEAVEGQS